MDGCLTPHLYLPCKHCGLWRRQHQGKNRKCLFDATTYAPVLPKDLTAKDRRRLLDRLAHLELQLVIRKREALEALEKDIDKVVMVATEGCPHEDDEGKSLIAIDPPYGIEVHREHHTCKLCSEDWWVTK